MEYKIAILPGDGIGPEVMESAKSVLKLIEKKFNITFIFIEGLIGGAAYDKYNSHFPKETKKICLESDAILFGSVGGPINEQHTEKWKNCEANSILALRKTFSFHANLRPIKIYKELDNLCPLKKEIIAGGIDILILRELIGDIYFGEHKTYIKDNQKYATDIAEYSEDQITNIAHEAFKASQLRSKKVTSVDKANVLDTSKLWREVVSNISKDYPDVELEHMLVDNCAMQIIKNPRQFDVILTSNMFGDILSDAAAVLPGSLGLLPSASLNKDGFGLYEPSGGSAPDIAGKNIANPVAQILSAALMLRHSFQLENEAKCIEQAVLKTLKLRFRTGDIYEVGTKKLTCSDFTDEILKQI